MIRAICGYWSTKRLAKRYSEEPADVIASFVYGHKQQYTEHTADAAARPENKEVINESPTGLSA
jgi:hypothetical protein